MNESSFLSHLTGRWGGISLRGLAAPSFGMTAFIWPEPTLVALTLSCGAYVVFDGVFAQMAAFRIRDQQKPLWPLVIVGLVGVSAGVATFIWPDITALSLLLLIAVWALVMGAFQIATAIRIRKTLEIE